jgi:hypothetical protein
MKLKDMLLYIESSIRELDKQIKELKAQKAHLKGVASRIESNRSPVDIKTDNTLNQANFGVAYCSEKIKDFFRETGPVFVKKDKYREAVEREESFARREYLKYLKYDARRRRSYNTGRNSRNAGDPTWYSDYEQGSKTSDEGGNWSEGTGSDEGW